MACRADVTIADGLIENSIGYPTHQADSAYRAVLLFNEGSLALIEQLQPGCTANASRGSFGENFTISGDELMPSEVCIGDHLEIGTGKPAVTIVRGFDHE